MKSKHLLLTVAVLGSLFAVKPALAQGSAFTYQGRLTSGTNAANGNYDLRFILYTADVGGSQSGPILTNSPVLVTNGLFTVSLDFGAAVFTGANRWLEVSVRTNGGGAFTPLNPRQPITSTPYAVVAAAVTGAVSDAQLSANIPRLNANQTFSGNVNFTGAGNLGIGTSSPFDAKLDLEGNLRLNDFDLFLRNGSDRNHGLGWFGSSKLFSGVSVDGPVLYGFAGGGLGSRQISGDVIALRWTAGGNVGIGTTNPLERLHVAGRFLRVDGDGSEQAYIGGDGIGGEVQVGSMNPGISKVVMFNTVNGLMDLDAAHGGFSELESRGSVALDNGATNNGALRPGLLFGGFGSGEGISSQRTTNGPNRYGIDFYTAFQKRLSIFNGGAISVGGTNADHLFDVNGNTAIRGTLLVNSRDNQDASFPELPGILFGDYNSGEVITSQRGTNGVNRYGLDFLTGNARRLSIANGGNVGIGTNAPQHKLHVFNPSQDNAFFDSSSGGGTWVGFANSSPGGKAWSVISTGNLNGEGAGKLLLFVDSARRFEFRPNGDFITTGTINPPSDRAVKENFRPVNVRDVLEKVAALPITEWSYRQDPETRHVGPVAQDFHAAFGVGTDDKHISTVDADGVALAAIQGLNQKLEEQRAENAELKRRLEKLERLIAARDAPEE